MAQAKTEASKIQATMNIPDHLLLKKGANVMCTVNLDVEVGICNGSQGTIIDFRKGYPVVRFLNNATMTIKAYTWKSEDIEGVGVSQVPLLLGYACTIHRSQGSTLDSAEINAGEDVFADGQLYVALSRVRGLEHLYLSAFDESALRTDPKVVEYYRRFK